MRDSVCAFNITRQAFLSLGVAIADSPLARLRGLLGKTRLRSNEALWVVPSHGIHTIGLMFSIDVIYLDANLKVIDLIENLAPMRISRFRLRAASVLQLPARSISESCTRMGDQFLIGSAEEMERYWTDRTPSELPNATRAGPERRSKERPGSTRID